MSQLLDRYYQKVYVHYVPLQDYLPCGTEENVAQQVDRLRRKVLEFSALVQKKREENWMRYDYKLLSMVFRYAFQHLAARVDEPFDFSVLRRQAAVPETTEVKLTRFLEFSLTNRVKLNFVWACQVVASSLVRHALRKSNLGKWDFPVLPWRHVAYR
jgi:hypothetical protein